MKYILYVKKCNNKGDDYIKVETDELIPTIEELVSDFTKNHPSKYITISIFPRK